MTQRARRTLQACATPGCPELTTSGHCATHTRAARALADAQRGSWRERGYDTEYDRNRATVLREETHCWLCGDPVDKNLRAPDPRSASADHIERRADGGTNARPNLRLAHLGCNAARRDTARRAADTETETRGTTTSPRAAGPWGSAARCAREFQVRA